MTPFVLKKGVRRFDLVRRTVSMIAIDVMGGDQAPGVVLEGALAAAKKSVPVILYGPKEMIHHWLSTHDNAWEQYAIVVADADDHIAMDEEPVSAVRKKRSSSLVKAVSSVAAGESIAVLSAGNSGALMAASALIIGRKEGIERPAIAGFLPTTQGNVLALDLGANTECRPYHLFQFAHMGNDYMRHALNLEHPRIGLLSNGHEEGKGSMLVKETHKLLKTSNLNFIGNIEPYDIFNHKADVVVCDGFSGNVQLKTLEAVCDLVTGWVDPTLKQQLMTKLAHKQLGGALLLGINGNVVVCHGNSDAQVIENAILFAYKSCK